VLSTVVRLSVNRCRRCAFVCAIAKIRGRALEETDSMFTLRRTRVATRIRRRLLLETLEDRTLLSTVTWTGADAAVSTNWSDAKNWSSDTIPVAGDTVIFDNNAQNDASTVDAAYISDGALGDLQIDWSGTITIDSGVTLSVQNKG
jgi:hypothetical protein